MQDIKRATGRTTRMVWAAAEYLVANPDKPVVLVAHNDAGVSWLAMHVHKLLSHDLCKRIEFKTYRHWSTSGIGKRDDHFFDHHCFYAEVCNLHNRLAEIKAQLERAEKDYLKYDL